MQEETVLVKVIARVSEIMTLSGTPGNVIHVYYCSLLGHLVFGPLIARALRLTIRQKL